MGLECNIFISFMGQGALSQGCRSRWASELDIKAGHVRQRRCVHRCPREPCSTPTTQHIIKDRLRGPHKKLVSLPASSPLCVPLSRACNVFFFSRFSSLRSALYPLWGHGGKSTASFRNFSKTTASSSETSSGFPRSVANDTAAVVAAAAAADGAKQQQQQQ